MDTFPKNIALNHRYVNIDINKYLRYKVSNHFSRHRQYFIKPGTAIEINRICLTASVILMRMNIGHIHSRRFFMKTRVLHYWLIWVVLLLLPGASVLLHAQESCTETYGSGTQRFILATGSPGDPVLINTYHALCQPEGATAGQPVAAQFIDFVASEKGQTVIRNFGKDQFGEGLYNDAEYARQYDH